MHQCYTFSPMWIASFGTILLEGIYRVISCTQFRRKYQIWKVHRQNFLAENMGTYSLNCIKYYKCAFLVIWREKIVLKVIILTWRFLGKWKPCRCKIHGPVGALAGYIMDPHLTCLLNKRCQMEKRLAEGILIINKLNQQQTAIM